jgi:hypothetical protein
MPIARIRCVLYFRIGSLEMDFGHTYSAFSTPAMGSGLSCMTSKAAAARRASATRSKMVRSFGSKEIKTSLSSGAARQAHLFT